MERKQMETRIERVSVTRKARGAGRREKAFYLLFLSITAAFETQS